MTFILNSVPYIFVDTGPLTSDIATSEQIELVLIVSKSVSAARLPESLNTPRGYTSVFDFCLKALRTLFLTWLNAVAA